MLLNEQQIQKLNKIGIKDVDNLTESDKDLIIESYLNKKIDKELFISSFKDVTTSEMLDVLKNLSRDNKEVSNNVFKLIDKVLDGLQEDLKRAETQEERKAIREEMQTCIDKAREESDSTKKIFALIGFVVLAGLGAAGRYIIDSLSNNKA